MPLKVNKNFNASIAHWTDLAAGQNGDGASLTGKKSVQVKGTFGDSTVKLEGSNDGVNWVTLHDQAVPANELSFTANGLKGILESTAYVRPTVNGTTGTAIEVIILAE